MRIKIPSDPTLRTLIFSNFVNTFGNGLWRTLEVIFFSIYLGFGAHQVAVALSVAGAVGLIFSIPIGYLADRFGPRGLAILGFIGEGLILLCYLTIKSTQAARASPKPKRNWRQRGTRPLARR